MDYIKLYKSTGNGICSLAEVVDIVFEDTVMQLWFSKCVILNVKEKEASYVWWYWFRWWFSIQINRWLKVQAFLSASVRWSFLKDDKKNSQKEYYKHGRIVLKLIDSNVINEIITVTDNSLV